MEAMVQEEVRIPCSAAINRRMCMADCCGPIPFPSAQYFELKKNAAVPPSVEVLSEDGQYIFPISEDLRCVFLDRASLKCNIYEERPDVCRNYGLIEDLPCPCFKTSGAVRTRAERREMRRRIGAQMRAMAQRQLKRIGRKI